MNIMIIETIGDGGIAHYTYNLAAALSKHANSIYLFTSAKYEFEHRKNTFRVFPKMFSLTERLIRFMPCLQNAKPLPSMARRMFKLIEYPFNALQALILAGKLNVRVIHFQSVNWIELFMVFMFRLAGFKTVYTVHNIMPHHKKLRLHHIIIYKLLYGLCRRLIIHSEKGKDELINLFGIEQDKVSVIPHGDYKFFLPKNMLSQREAKETLGISSQCKTILFFGAIRPNKGLDQAIEIFARVVERVSDARLLIIGELWEDFDKYERQISKHNIQNNIYTRLNYVANEELPIYFIASDIVLLPYYEITGSGVLQIAYAFSKPVVATDLECFREVIEDGENGYLVARHDYSQFAERIVSILENDIRKSKMGQYSKRLADRKYSWDVIAEKTIEVYGM